MALVACLSGLLTLGAPLQVATETAVPPQTAQDKEQQRHKKEVEEDVKLGKEVSQQVDKELPASENKEYVERVQRIGKDIAEIANKTHVKVTWGDPRLSLYDYQFKVLKGDDVNAFSLPGGFIYVYEGCVAFCESDDELAGVLAHEVSHASFRHIATLRKEQSKFDIVNIPLILAAIFSKSPEAGNILVGADLLNRAVGSGWGVKAEEAADYGGLQYMIGSKYNPLGMLTFMERLAFKDRAQPSVNYTIFQTHPPTAERARALMGRLRDANITIRRSAVSTSLRSNVLPGEDNSVELWFGKSKLYVYGGTDALTRADAAATALNAFFDSVPALYELNLIDKTKIVGQDKLLIETSPDDGPNPTQNAEIAFSVLKRLLFDLNYRLWQNHDRAIGLGGS